MRPDNTNNKTGKKHNSRAVIMSMERFVAVLVCLIQHWIIQICIGVLYVYPWCMQPVNAASRNEIYQETYCMRLLVSQEYESSTPRAVTVKTINLLTETERYRGWRSCSKSFISLSAQRFNNPHIYSVFIQIHSACVNTCILLYMLYVNVWPSRISICYAHTHASLHISCTSPYIWSTWWVW